MDGYTTDIGEDVRTNAVASCLASMALWFRSQMATKEGGEYKTMWSAIKYGLKQVKVPFVRGFVDTNDNPALRTVVADGNTRASAYNLDHTGKVVNTALESAYRERKTGTELHTGLRPQCDCGTPGCWVHLAERVGGLCRLPKNPDAMNWVLDGSLAPQYHNKVQAGTYRGKVPTITAIGDSLWFTGKGRIVYKRSGAGRSGGFKPVAFRYATTCTGSEGCGKATCFGQCRDDSHMRFTLVQSEQGLVMAGVDPREAGYENTMSVLKSLGAEVKEYPFDSGTGGEA